VPGGLLLLAHGGVSGRQLLAVKLCVPSSTSVAVKSVVRTVCGESVLPFSAEMSRLRDSTAKPEGQDLEERLSLCLLPADVLEDALWHRIFMTTPL